MKMSAMHETTIRAALLSSIVLAVGALGRPLAAQAREADGLAPEIADLSAEDVSYALEKSIPDLERAYLNSTPADRADGIRVGMLGVDGGDREAILKFANEVAAGQHGEVDSRLHTNPQETSYGWFWWRHDMRVGDRKFDCISGRGAGGQFILMLPELDLVVVVTAHNQGMGAMLATVPKRVLPAFLSN